MPIRIYSPMTLNLIQTIGKVSSVQWVRKFSDVGNFEIHFPPGTSGIEVLQIGNYIEFGDKSGIIGCREQTVSDIKISGYDMNGLSKLRCTVPPFVYKENPETIDGYDRIKGTAEEVLRYYVKQHMITPSDSKRVIPFVQLGTLMQGVNLLNMAWQSRFETLDTVLSDVCTFAEVGFRFHFSPKDSAIWFDVLKGTDRTAGQSSVAPVIFCRKYKNISDYSYTEDKLKYVNLVYAGGNGEEETQYITELHDGTEADEPSGAYRHEGFYETSSDDVDEVDSKGRGYLKENSCEEVIEASAGSRLVYKKDWDLGDYVTVKADIFGETVFADKQITEVREVYEPGKITIEPTFGEKRKEVKDD